MVKLFHLAEHLVQEVDVTKTKEDSRVFRKSVPEPEVKEEIDAKEAAPKAAPKRRATRAKRKA